MIFHQEAIAIHQNWPIILLASGFIAYGTAGFFINFFIGSLVDSFSAQKIQKFLLAPLALSLISILISNSALTVYLYLGLMGTSVAMVRGTSAMWAEVYGTKHLGAIKSLVGVMVINATALGPVIFGYLLEVTTLPNIVIGHLIYMACITGLAYFATPPKNRRRK